MGKRTNTAKWLEKYNRWQIKVQKDGVRKTFTDSTPGRKGMRLCHDKADAWLDDNIDKSNLRVSALFQDFISELKITTSKDHWRQYEGYGRNKIIPKIGNKKIENVTEQDLQTVINLAYKEKNLNKKTLNNIKACLTAFMKFCRKCNATRLVPENLYIPNSAQTKEKTILQPDDLKILLESNMTTLRDEEKEELYINAYRFEVVTGLRPGEVIGIKKDDICNNVVALKRSINRDGKETDGKNKNAKRSFALTEFARKILDDQEELLKRWNIRSDYVFPNEYGEAIRQATYYKRWVRYRNHNGIRKVSPYELRHTFVSITKSLPEGILKSLVGHSKSMDTYGVYSHEVTGDLEFTADQVNDIFRSILSRNDNAAK